MNDITALSIAELRALIEEYILAVRELKELAYSYRSVMPGDCIKCKRQTALHTNHDYCVEWEYLAEHR